MVQTDAALLEYGAGTLRRGLADPGHRASANASNRRPSESIIGRRPRNGRAARGRTRGERSKFDAVRMTCAMPLTSIGFAFVGNLNSNKTSLRIVASTEQLS
jgi:hypothetical protein